MINRDSVAEVSIAALDYLLSSKLVGGFTSELREVSKVSEPPPFVCCLVSESLPHAAGNLSVDLL